jgi:hypothetical protein
LVVLDAAALTVFLDAMQATAEPERIAKLKPTPAPFAAARGLAGKDYASQYPQLDVDETRHGLANAIDAAGDITCSPHPEVAEAYEPLRIVVDWERFADERISIRFATPDEV